MHTVKIMVQNIVSIRYTTFAVQSSIKFDVCFFFCYGGEMRHCTIEKPANTRAKNVAIIGDGTEYGDSLYKRSFAPWTRTQS